jgi:hypothetical protein
MRLNERGVIKMSSNSSYESVAQISTIRATSRASVKIKESFYTVEYCEERTLPQNNLAIDIDKERELLWDKVNSEVDNQIEEIIKTFAN